MRRPQFTVNFFITKLIEKQRKRRNAIFRNKNPNNSEENDELLKNGGEGRKNEEEWNKHLDYFSRSMAGSIVTSYILDLGDRHSGNLCVEQRNFTIFHIDFGHILGHKKSKFGFKREVEPFIYLKEMHNLIKYNPVVGKTQKGYNFNYIKLQEYCGEGFNIARENFLVFENLLTLVIPAHINELDKESIEKTMKNFMLDTPNYMAKLKMKEMLDKAFRVKRRRFDNWFRLRCEWTKKLVSQNFITNIELRLYLLLFQKR